MALDGQAPGLGTGVGYLVEAAGHVAAAQVGVGVDGYFAGYKALHKLQHGHFETKDVGVVAVVEDGGAGKVEESAVLPIAGRAAIMKGLLGCQPPVSPSGLRSW